MILWSTGWSLLPPALPSLVHSHHRIFWSDLRSLHKSSVLLSYFYNNINKLTLISDGHLLTDTTTLKGQNWSRCNPTRVDGNFTETTRRINSRRINSASHPRNNSCDKCCKASRCCSFTPAKYCGSYWSQWNTTTFHPTTTEALKANFAPSPASVVQKHLHSYLASKYQGLNLHFLLF